ncbi:MAG: amidohydrolase family protein [Elusimicrobiota bacterium]
MRSSSRRRPPPLADMHAHILERADTAAEMRVADRPDFPALVSALELRLGARGVVRALVHLLDGRVIGRPLPPSRRLAFTALLDFRTARAEESVRRARRGGLAGLKLLPYEQKIRPADYPTILRAARETQRQKMFLVLCSTFGSRSLYEHDALALASHLLQKGYAAPLILAHAGGCRVREAYLLMDDAPNVYIDTSFTTTYWKGSGVIDDLAHLIRRFPDRCFFGSDSPGVPWEEALRDAQPLLRRLPASVRRKLLHDNAAEFLRQRSPAR